MSLECCASKVVPKVAVISGDGYLYDRDTRTYPIVSSIRDIGVIIPVSQNPYQNSPNTGTPSRNICSLLGLMRAEMDRLIIESFRSRLELIEVRDRIACALSTRRNSALAFAEFFKNN
jgi:hypothetical protein